MLLLQHWKSERGVSVYLSTMKLLQLDMRNVLRMTWWEANEKLKEPAPERVHGREDHLVQFDIGRGGVLEGTVRWGNATAGPAGGLCFAYARHRGRWAASFVKVNGSHVLTGESTATDCATAAGAAVTAVNDTLGISTEAPEPSRHLRLPAGARVRFRLLFRRGMWELYLRDVDRIDALILSYALPVRVNGAAKQLVRLLGSWASCNLSFWRMSLPEQ